MYEIGWMKKKEKKKRKGRISQRILYTHCRGQQRADGKIRGMKRKYDFSFYYYYPLKKSEKVGREGEAERKKRKSGLSFTQEMKDKYFIIFYVSFVDKEDTKMNIVRDVYIYIQVFSLY